MSDRGIGTDPKEGSMAGHWRRIAVTILMTTATHYNHSGTVWLLVFAAGLLGGVAFDVQRRKNAWRR